MLVLTRKLDESIIIEGNIAITVLGVDRDRVKIGIAAPSGTSVLREELVKDGQAIPGRAGERAVADSAPAVKALPLPQNITAIRAPAQPQTSAVAAPAPIRRRFEKRSHVRAGRLQAIRATA